MTDEIRVNAGLIYDAINAITQQRNIIVENMNTITREYNMLGDTMEGDALSAATEFQEVAARMLNNLDETLSELNRIAVQYGDNSQAIDSGVGRSIRGI